MIQEYQVRVLPQVAANEQSCAHGWQMSTDSMFVQ